MESAPTFLFLFELLFFTGAVLAFGVWQWWSVNREIARDRARKAAEEAAKKRDEDAAA